jgi:hypothetical protein
MIGWLAATLTGSAWTRTALRYGITALASLLFLLALRRSGEHAGRLVASRPSPICKRESRTVRRPVTSAGNRTAKD